MDSRHSGDRVTLLEIETDAFKMVWRGNFEDNKSKALKLNQNIPATLMIGGELGKHATVRTCTSQKELVESTGQLMMPSFFEHGTYQLMVEEKNHKQYTLTHMNEPLDHLLDRMGCIQVGSITFSSDIGYSTFEVMDGKNCLLRITIEVFPSKMDYRKDYQEMIGEINEQICSVAFELLGKTYLNTQLVDTNHQSNAEYINILRVIFDDLERAIRRIEKNPKHAVRTIEEQVKMERARGYSSKTIGYVRKNAHTLVPHEKGPVCYNGESYMPSQVVTNRKVTTIDIFENQFVKAMIVTVIRRLKKIEQILCKQEVESNYYLDYIAEKRKCLENHITHFFRQISDLSGKKSMSLVFQMAPAYKEVFQKYMMLKKGLALGEDLYQMTPKKLYNLYEIWCYMKVHHILAELGYEVEEYGILKYRDNGLYFSLIQDEEAKMVYRYQGQRLELWYNKSYSGLPTTQQRPDTVLCIKNQGDERIYLFDAKYRVYVDKQGNQGPMEEDINVMHRYRDAIVSRMGHSYQFKYDTFGAYVMFPCWDEAAFRHHRFYKSIGEVNIGALPMLPGCTQLMKQQLRTIIGETLLEAKNDRILVDTYDDYAKFKMENVMVVNVMNPQHLSIYQQHQFYHIPCDKLRNVRTGVDYLAFYQSKNAFGDEAGIRWYYPIKEIRTYKRGECLELIPKKGTEENAYLRFELGEARQVGPISPKQAGTQLMSYTTLYLLQNAQNMHELKFKSSLEITVYKKITRWAKEQSLTVRKQNESYWVGEHQIEIINGKKLRVDGKIIHDVRWLDKNWV